MFIFVGKDVSLSPGHTTKLHTPVATLNDQHKGKIYESGSYSINLSPKEKNQNAELIGDKFFMHCSLNKWVVSTLLDTGAQVLIISDNYMQQNYPNAEINHISHILDEHDTMRVQWGDQADTPFNGFTVMQLNIGYAGVSCHVDVPFLFTANHPIVGFSAIKHIAK